MDNAINKLTDQAVKQNLLLWQLSKSFLDIEKKIIQSLGKQDNATTTT